MGVFSEMSMENAFAEQENIVPFVVEADEAAEQPDAGAFPDEDRQQAEAKAAPAALAYLTKEHSDGENGEGAGPEEDSDTGEDKPELSQAQKKKEHEEQEAKRKAEWEEKQKAKQEAEQIAWENAVAMSDDALMSASLKRVGTDSERLTRRNMKICVTEHIQTRCLEDMVFARQVMHPRKNMINCFKYINRQALEFIKKEMDDNDEMPGNNGFGGDVPDDLCYKWAEDYFNDMDAPEDQDKDDKFEPKPFYGGYTPSKKKKPPAKKPEKNAPQKPAPAKKAEESDSDGQLSLLGGLTA